MSREEEETEKGFKVEDKRRFDAEGNPRADGEEAGADEAAGGGEAAASDAGAGADGGGGSTAASGQAADAATAAAADSAIGAEAEPQAGAETVAGGAASDSTAGANKGELSFSGFIVGLATQALTLLGAMPDRATGEVAKNFPEAAAMIDILSMLAEKTAGNLAEDEERLLEDVLYDLRMRYVRETRTQGQGAEENE